MAKTRVREDEKRPESRATTAEEMDAELDAWMRYWKRRYGRKPDLGEFLLYSPSPPWDDLAVELERVEAERYCKRE